MIEIIVDWIKESIRIEDTDKNQYGVVRFAEIEFDVDCEFVDEQAYKNEVMSMYENDLINMRDNEIGEEQY